MRNFVAEFNNYEILDFAGEFNYYKGVIKIGRKVEAVSLSAD